MHGFLPDGEWVDAWSDEWFSGPLTVERGTPLDEIPAYVRGRSAGELGPLFKDLS